MLAKDPSAITKFLQNPRKGRECHAKMVTAARQAIVVASGPIGDELGGLNTRETSMVCSVLLYGVQDYTPIRTPPRHSISLNANSLRTKLSQLTLGPAFVMLCADADPQKVKDSVLVKHNLVRICRDQETFKVGDSFYVPCEISVMDAPVELPEAYEDRKKLLTNPDHGALVRRFNIGHEDHPFMVLVPLQGFMFCENARRLLAEAIEEGDEHSNLSFAFKRARFATLEHLHPMVVVSQDDRTPLMNLYKTLIPDTAREEPPAPWHLALLSPSYSMPVVKEEHVLLASNRKTFHFGKMADRAALRSESLEFTQISLLRNNFKELIIYSRMII